MGHEICATTLDFSLAIMKGAKAFTYLNVETNTLCELTVKIGIHYGLVYAGVIGYHKP